MCLHLVLYFAYKWSYCLMLVLQFMFHYSTLNSCTVRLSLFFSWWPLCDFTCTFCFINRKFSITNQLVRWPDLVVGHNNRRYLYLSNFLINSIVRNDHPCLKIFLKRSYFYLQYLILLLISIPICGLFVSHCYREIAK